MFFRSGSHNDLFGSETENELAGKMNPRVFAALQEEGGSGD